MYLPPNSPKQFINISDMNYRLLRIRRWWASNTFLRTMSFIIISLTCLLAVPVIYLMSSSPSESPNLVTSPNTVFVNKRATESLRPGTLINNYQQKGRVFDSRGRGSRNFTVPMTTSLVYSFSPEAETFFKEAFYDPYNENVYVSLGPAIIDQDDGSMLSVQRMWLSHYDVLFNKDPDIKTRNTWQENFLYKRTFTSNWSPQERGHIMGIPSATNCHYVYRSDGPMDPRLFRWNGTIYLSFHLWQFDRDQQDIRGRMFMWHYEKNRLFKINVPETFKHRLQRTEINWIPIVVNSSLYYIYSFDPLRVFKCSNNGDCIYAQWPSGEGRVPFDPASDALRGGSPFILYKWPYYISIGHSQVGNAEGKLLYGAHLIVISVHPRFRLVYVSSPIDVKSQILSSAKITRQYTILRPFLFPVGIILRSLDIIDFSAHLSDTRGYIFRLKGVEEVMENVISIDNEYNTKSISGSEDWEPVRFRYAHSLIARDTAAYHRMSQIVFPEIVDNL